MEYLGSMRYGVEILVLGYLEVIFALACSEKGILYVIMAFDCYLQGWVLPNYTGRYIHPKSKKREKNKIGKIHITELQARRNLYIDSSPWSPIRSCV